jgi:hypothetical protein
LKDAFFNVVLETNIGINTASYDFNFPDWSIWRVEDQSNRMFVTEKTIKPFIIGQIPIFIAIPGHVRMLRELGFDMFDDIIDHSYDKEDDSDTRMKLAIDQLERVCQLSIDYWNKFFADNMHRLEANKSQVTTVSKMNNNRITDHVEKYIK